MEPTILLSRRSNNTLKCKHGVETSVLYTERVPYRWFRKYACTNLMFCFICRPHPLYTVPLQLKSNTELKAMFYQHYPNLVLLTSPLPSLKASLPKMTLLDGEHLPHTTPHWACYRLLSYPQCYKMGIFYNVGVYTVYTNVYCDPDRAVCLAKLIKLGCLHKLMKPGG